LPTPRRAFTTERRNRTEVERMTDKHRLSELLLRWEEGREQGRDMPAGELCRECPELEPDLAAAIADLRRVVWLDDADDGPAPDAEEPSRLPPAARLRPFRRGAEPIPGYRLLRRLGVGAFGQVWAAVSPDGEMQALKIMHGLNHVRLEAEALDWLRGISHPMLLSIYRVEQTDETLMIVSELADSSLSPLFEMLRRLEPPLRVAKKCLSLLRCAAEGLDYLHSLDLLHLDVKPANLLVVGQHWCKVGDFGTLTGIKPTDPAPEDVVLNLPGQAPEGSATVRYGSVRNVPWGEALHRDATLFTRFGAFTPYFAPPEAFSGMISRTFDEYSLALTFCELISGRIPFTGDGERQVEQRARGEFDLSFLPPQLRLLVARALSPTPAERFPSCRALINTLERALDLSRV
jgi:serine/threonine protein kinase